MFFWGNFYVWALEKVRPGPRYDLKRAAIWVVFFAVGLSTLPLMDLYHSKFNSPNHPILEMLPLFVSLLSVLPHYKRLKAKK